MITKAKAAKALNEFDVEFFGKYSFLADIDPRFGEGVETERIMT